MSKKLMFRLTKHSNDIEEVEVTRMTEKTIYFIGWGDKEKSERISSNYYSFFETRDAAIADIIARAEKRVEQLKDALGRAIQELEKVKQL